MGGTSSLGVRDGVQVKGAGQVLEPDGAQELPTGDQGLVGLAPKVVTPSHVGPRPCCRGWAPVYSPPPRAPFWGGRESPALSPSSDPGAVSTGQTLQELLGDGGHARLRAWAQ